jgi:hypothetical protein
MITFLNIYIKFKFSRYLIIVLSGENKFVTTCHCWKTPFMSHEILKFLEDILHASSSITIVYFSSMLE